MSSFASTTDPDSTSRRRRIWWILPAAVGLFLVLLVVVFSATRRVPGTRLLYQVEAPGAATDFVAVLQQRLRRLPDSWSRVGVAGPQRVEILVASREGRTVEMARDLIESMGVMRFLVIANPNDHADLIQLAAEQSTAAADAALTRELRDAEGSVVGRWVTVASNKELQGPLRTLDFDITHIAGATVRRADTGAIVDLPTGAESGAGEAIDRWMTKRGIEALEVLAVVEPEHSVDGSDFALVMHGYDQQGNPSVRFKMNDAGDQRLYALTAANAPDGSHSRQLGIVFDDVLVTAPRIQGPIKGDGQISGNFTETEIDLLVAVLQSGRLPAELHEVPGSGESIEMQVRLVDHLR